MKLRKLLFVLPNLFTVSSFFCGFYAATLCTGEATPAQLYQAALAIFFGYLLRRLRRPRRAPDQDPIAVRHGARQPRRRRDASAPLRRCWCTAGRCSRWALAASSSASSSRALRRAAARALQRARAEGRGAEESGGAAGTPLAKSHSASHFFVGLPDSARRRRHHLDDHRAPRRARGECRPRDARVPRSPAAWCSCAAHRLDGEVSHVQGPAAVSALGRRLHVHTRGRLRDCEALAPGVGATCVLRRLPVSG